MTVLETLTQQLFTNYRMVDLSVEIRPGVQKVDGHYQWGNQLRKFEIRQFIAPGPHFMYWVETETHVGTHVELPAHIIDAINKVAKLQRKFLQQYGREATVPELAQRLSTPKEKIEAVTRISQFGVSLDKPVDDDESSFIGDFICDEKTASPSHAAGVSLLAEKLEEALRILSKREEKVLRLRFGLGDGCPRTLEEVGQIFNITRERVRQIEAKALKKLRHPVRMRKFEELRDLLQ